MRAERRAEVKTKRKEFTVIVTQIRQTGRQASCAWGRGLVFEGMRKEVTAQVTEENGCAKVEVAV